MYKSILLVVDTALTPVRRNGMSIRWFPLIRGLRKAGYTVDLVILNRYSEKYSREEIEEQEQVCGQVDIIDVPEERSFGLRLVRRAWNALHLIAPFGTPFAVLENNRGYFIDWLTGLLAGRERYDIGIGIGLPGRNVEILLSLDESVRPVRIIGDVIDSIHLMLKHSRSKNSRWLSPLIWLEDNKTRRWEQSLCKCCDCVYVTEEDAEVAGRGNARVIPNGIVIDGLDISVGLELKSPCIGFLGDMSYEPNIDASNVLVREIFPRLRKQVPGIQLYIIGRNPRQELLDQCRDPDVHVTGSVENIWDYIRSVDVFVFPMVSGAGLQNKVLEAMYAGKPVVASAIANEGIGAEHGKVIYIAGSVDEYVSCIEKAIADPAVIGERAKRFITDNFSEEKLLGSYLGLLEKPVD